MTRARLSIAVVALVATALTACRSVAPTSGHAPKASPAPTASLAPTAPARPGVAPPVVATLTGHIAVPAQIIANHGGGIISDGGGNRRLLVTAQAPVKDVLVTVSDASGQPVPGAQARTDASGAYAITVALPASNLVLAAALPGQAGTVQAIVAPAAHQVDGDVVSTLTTGYILDRYVKGDPQILAKLPADVEAATRASAAAAIGNAAALTAVPDALTPARVVAAVEALRKADAGFDAQMEAVKQLLIAAGQTDLGNGQLATEVALGPGMLASAPDGTLVIVENLGERIWGLRAGRLVNLAGVGSARRDDEPAVEGQDATKAALEPLGVAWDAAGRMIVAETDRLVRLDAQGKLHLVGTFGAARLRAFAPGKGDEVIALVSTAKAARLAAFAPGQPERLLKTFEGADLAYFKNQGDIGALGQWDGGGKLVFTAFTDTDVVERRAFDLAALTFGAPELLPDYGTTFYDAAGNRFEGRNKQITLTPAGGTPRVVTTLFEEQNLFGGCLAPDGRVYVAGQTRVYRVEADGKLTPVAGQAGNGKGDANAISFNDPAGVAVAPDGTLYVSDQGTNQIVRVGPDHQAKPYAGIQLDQIVGEPLEEGPALQVSLAYPFAPRLDGAGNVYAIVDLRRVARVSTAGQVTTAYTSPDQPTDLVVAADGTLYVASNAGTPTLVRVPPGGEAVTLLKDAGGDNTHDLRLALGADGKVWISGNGKLRTWTAAAGVQPVRSDPRFDNTADMAVDARGRLYLMDDDTILRYDDPAVAAFTRVAGPGTAKFGGKGADDGLSAPAGMAFGANGDLYFADSGHKQVKQIPANEL